MWLVIHLGYWIHGPDVSMFVAPLLPCCSLCARVALCGQPYLVHLWTERSFSIVVTAGIPWGPAYLLPCRLQTLHNSEFLHEARIQCYRQRVLWFTTTIDFEASSVETSGSCKGGEFRRAQLNWWKSRQHLLKPKVSVQLTRNCRTKHQ